MARVIPFEYVVEPGEIIPLTLLDEVDNLVNTDPVKEPYCEIVCSPEVADSIGLKESNWVLTKSGFVFENWELRDKKK